MNTKNTPNVIKNELRDAIKQTIENENREFGEQECSFCKVEVLTKNSMKPELMSQNPPLYNSVIRFHIQYLKIF